MDTTTNVISCPAGAAISKAATRYTHLHEVLGYCDLRTFATLVVLQSRRSHHDYHIPTSTEPMTMAEEEELPLPSWNEFELRRLRGTVRSRGDNSGRQPPSLSRASHNVNHIPMHRPDPVSTVSAAGLTTLFAAISPQKQTSFIILLCARIF